VGRTRNRRGEGDQLREELLDAVEELLAETGDERSLTIRAIVQRAGVTPPSLYLHFDSKDTLIREAIIRRLDALARTIDAGIEVDATPAQAIRGWCCGYLRWARDEPGGYALLFTSRRDTRLETGGPTGIEAFRRLVEMIAAAQREGTARAGDAEQQALTVWAPLHGIATMTTQRPSLDWPSETSMIDDLLHGILDLPPTPPG